MTNLDHIIPDLRSLAVPLDDLKLDAANARTGHALDRIAASLHRYGQRKPIVVNRSEGNKIEAGNGTWQAAKSLGWTHIAAVFVEDDPMTAVGYGIADNRLGDLSEWDAETLQALVDGLDPELNLPTGFDDDELAAMLAELGAGLGDGGGGEPGDAEPQTNRAEELRQEWGVKPGQLWRLPSRTPGQEHRLICGDCTDTAVVDRVMGGEKADLGVTSPPYNQHIDKFKPSGMHKEGDWVAKVERLAYEDSMPEGDYQKSQRDAIDVWFGVFRDGASFFYNHKNRYREKQVVSPLNWLPGEFRFRQEIIWSRPGSVTQNARMFLPSDERIYWLYRGDDFYFDDSTEIKSYSTVWDINLDANKDHAVAFPIELPTRCIKACSIYGQIVFEPYSGSGTTIIAAENLSRQCRAVEISPAYVAVALRRYYDAFGITPELVTDETAVPHPAEATA